MATRKKCKRCRITKCFETGMRRDWIMTDVEREEKRKKIQANRRRKRTDFEAAAYSADDSQAESPANCGSNLNGSFSASEKMPVRRRRRRRQNSLLDPKGKRSEFDN